MKLSQLNDLIANVCPIYGINSDGVIDFKPEATNGQRNAANAIMSAQLHKVTGVDPNDAIQQQIDDVEAQFTTTLQMMALAGDPPSLATVSNLKNQLVNLKGQLS